jgi:hypothetical protein
MTYRRTDHVTARKVAGETLLVPVKGHLAELHKVYTLNTVAEWVWEQLDGKRTVAELCEQVVSRFDVSRPAAQADLAELIEKLEKIGLIEPVSDPNAQ